MTLLNPISSRSARIRRNFESGTLLAHMLEFDPTDDDTYEDNRRAFFSVMNGDKGSVFKNQYHTFEAISDQDIAERFKDVPHPGIAGMPTTALKAGFPVGLWTAHSKFGLLLDGSDTRHVNPLLVCSGDADSKVESMKLHLEGNERFHVLSTTQGVPIRQPHNIDMAENPPERIRMAREALDEYWKIAWKRRWDHPSAIGPMPEMNEINTLAHLKGVLGLIVSENPLSRMPMDTLPPTIGQDRYAEAVKGAMELRDWLHAAYPAIFSEKLPIMSYNKHRRENQLIELSEEQLQNPQLPPGESKAMHAAAPALPGGAIRGR